MKKAADSKGADEAPTSSTFGMSSGRGTVSTRTCWWNRGSLMSAENQSFRVNNWALGARGI